LVRKRIGPSKERKARKREGNIRVADMPAPLKVKARKKKKTPQIVKIEGSPFKEEGRLQTRSRAARTARLMGGKI